VVKLAKYYHRAPDHLTNDEVQAYLAQLATGSPLDLPEPPGA